MSEGLTIFGEELLARSREHTNQPEKRLIEIFRQITIWVTEPNGDYRFRRSIFPLGHVWQVVAGALEQHKHLRWITASQLMPATAPFHNEPLTYEWQWQSPKLLWIQPGVVTLPPLVTQNHGCIARQQR